MALILPGNKAVDGHFVVDDLLFFFLSLTVAPVHWKQLYIPILTRHKISLKAMGMWHDGRAGVREKVYVILVIGMEAITEASMVRQ